MIEQYLRTLAGVSTTETMAYVMMFAAVVTLPVLLFGPTAPYGRFSTTGWGFLINNKIAWITQEIPSLAVPVRTRSNMTTTLPATHGRHAATSAFRSSG